MRVIPVDSRRRHKASAFVVVAAMVVGAGCRSNDPRQRALVIARATTTTTALPGPTIVVEDGTIIGSPRGTDGAGASAPGRHHPPTVDSVPTIGGSGGLPFGPVQLPEGATTGSVGPAGTQPGTPGSETGPGRDPSPSSVTPATGPAPGAPDGAPYGPALPFTPEVPVPDGLVFVLAIGSDARPGTDPRHGNADSLHLLAVDPATGRGTVLGFPRDTWVDIPGHGKNKINAALRLGGPELQAQTIRQLTGLPVDYTILTGFDGFQRMVDELGGMNVEVTRKMDDESSGAHFDPGWHNMTGAEALSYSRDRKDAPTGDFARSEDQGHLMLAGLSKLRAEVGDGAGLARWIGVLIKYADLDSPPWELTQLASVARSLDPSRLTNLVVPGRPGTANSQFVVFLSADAAQIFLDLRADAVIGT